MFYGYLLAKFDKVTTVYFSYVPIVVVREHGFGFQVMKCRVFKQSQIDKLSNIAVNAPICYDIRTVKRGKFTYNNIISIEECNFEECNICLHPIIESECAGCDNLEAERIDGDYRILLKEHHDKGIKYVLVCEGVKVVFHLFDDFAKYPEWSQYAQGDIVYAKGWKNDYQFTRLRCMRKVG